MISNTFERTYTFTPNAGIDSTQAIRWYDFLLPQIGVNEITIEFYHSKDTNNFTNQQTLLQNPTAFNCMTTAGTAGTVGTAAQQQTQPMSARYIPSSFYFAPQNNLYTLNNPNMFQFIGNNFVSLTNPPNLLNPSVGGLGVGGGGGGMTNVGGGHSFVAINNLQSMNDGLIASTNVNTNNNNNNNGDFDNDNIVIAGLEVYGDIEMEDNSFDVRNMNTNVLHSMNSILQSQSTVYPAMINEKPVITREIIFQFLARLFQYLDTQNDKLTQEISEYVISRNEIYNIWKEHMVEKPHLTIQLPAFHTQNINFNNLNYGSTMQTNLNNMHSFGNFENISVKPGNIPINYQQNMNEQSKENESNENSHIKIGKLEKDDNDTVISNSKKVNKKKNNKIKK